MSLPYGQGSLDKTRRTGALRRPFLRLPAKIGLSVLAAALAAALLWGLTRPRLAVIAESGLLASCPAEAGTEFSTRFIHSVQKTPVEEFFTVNEARDGFLLLRTRYHSFGVGLPFLPTDGTFRREGDAFVMDGMNRPMPEIQFRPGLSTDLKITLPGEEILLADRVPLGSLVRVAIVPRWRIFLRAW
ncbi:MAG: DUF1850 domain-containing protein [Schwartzia sp.]|nr:DUF1850 domain-containing protein [Schwartzia sp. (in: firmicutes)]